MTPDMEALIRAEIAEQDEVAARVQRADFGRFVATLASNLAGPFLVRDLIELERWNKPEDAKKMLSESSRKTIQMAMDIAMVIVEEVATRLDPDLASEPAPTGSTETLPAP